MTSQMAIPGTAQTRSAPLRDANGRFTSSAKASAPAGDIPTSGRAISRPSRGQGIYTGVFDTFVPKVQDPMFYETLREAIPILDTAINKYVMLDGVVEIDCANDRLDRHAEEWSQGVQLNDVQLGFQAACSQWRGEMYEQGCGLLEFVANEKRNDITRLIVPDSKEIWYHREPDGSLTVWFQPGLRTVRQYAAPQGQIRAILQPVWNQSGYVAFDKNRAVKLDLINIVLGHNRPENSKPHGVSVLRSIPFVAKILTTLNNQVANVWERFGDPSYVQVYKTGGKRPDKKALEELNDKMAADLAAMVTAKRAGRSADMTRVIGKDDSFEFNVVGADRKILSIEGDGNMMIDQIVSGTDLCRTILNLPAQFEEKAGISSALFASRVRFESQRPLLSRPVAAMFKLRGVKIKPGDWKLKQVQPNYDDILLKAQANFMDAQRIAIYGITLPGDPVSTAPAAGNETAPPDPKKKSATKTETVKLAKQKSPDPIIATTTASVEREWMSLAAGVLQILGLPTAKLAADGTLSNEEIKQLMELAEKWTEELTKKGGYIDKPIESVFDIGVNSAVVESNLAAPLLVGMMREQALNAVKKLAFEQVKNTTFNFLKDEIIEALAKGAMEGSNPQEVARWLHQQFDGSRFRWARLVRSELGDATLEGKRAEYRAEGIAALVYIVSDPSCPVCNPKGGVYPIDITPKPIRDTHPNCACTIRPATHSEMRAAGLGYLIEMNPNPTADLLPEDINP